MSKKIDACYTAEILCATCQNDIIYVGPQGNPITKNQLLGGCVEGRLENKIKWGADMSCLSGGGGGRMSEAKIECDVTEVIIEGGFWHGKGKGKRFYSKDTDGQPVTLTKEEYDDMMVAGEVIEVVG